MLYWNKALSLATQSHVTSFNRLKRFIFSGAKLRGSKIYYWHWVLNRITTGPPHFAVESASWVNDPLRFYSIDPARQPCIKCQMDGWGIKKNLQLLLTTSEDKNQILLFRRLKAFVGSLVFILTFVNVTFGVNFCCWLSRCDLVAEVGTAKRSSFVKHFK